MSDSNPNSNPTGGDPNSNPNSGGGAAAPTDWTSGLNDEMKGFVQNKGFKDPTMVIDSYRNLEKLMGAPKERLVRLPDREDAPEWNEVYDRLGRPKDAKEYDLKTPEGGDPKMADWARNTLHELGIGKRQGETLVNKWNELMANDRKAFQDSMELKFTDESNALKKEWGAAHDENVKVAQRAGKEFGISGEQIDAIEKTLGFAGTMKLFHSIGSKVGEASFHTGDKNSGFGVLSPGQAQAKISELKNDKGWTTRYLGGDTQAKEEMNRLMRAAYPES